MTLLRGRVLCNDAALARRPTGRRGRWATRPRRRCSAAGEAGLGRMTLRRRLPRVAEVPFDSDRKRMTTVHADPATARLVICKGRPRPAPQPAPARGRPTPPRCGRGAPGRRAARAGRPRLPGPRPSPPADAPAAAAGLEQGLRLLGLVAMTDPPAPRPRATIAACRRPASTPVLITGDHPATAARSPTGSASSTDAGGAGRRLARRSLAGELIAA